MTVQDIANKIKTQLDWRGPVGTWNVFITLTREEAEILRQYILERDAAGRTTGSSRR